MELSAWLPPLLGGALIGLAAAMMMAVHGKIAGISGIFGSWITGVSQPGDRLWRGLFTAGLVTGGAIWAQVDPAQFTFTSQRSLIAMGVGGLMVGFGTRMGSGCASGHGVCGLARLSPRSIVSTVTFISSGAFAVFVVRQLLGGQI